LDFANKEKITEVLYPLFVHDIGRLLYHPQGSNGCESGVRNASSTYGPIHSSTAGDDRGSLSPSFQLAAALATPREFTFNTPGADAFPTPPTSASSVISVPVQQHISKNHYDETRKAYRALVEFGGPLYPTLPPLRVHSHTFVPHTEMSKTGMECGTKVGHTTSFIDDNVSEATQRYSKTD
jgi:hypothetical protein